MAAYAAATSLINLLEQVQSYHDRNALLLDEQLKQLASIQEKVSSFQTYLESCHSAHVKGAEDLEGRIADTCYVAEHVIELYIVGYIHSKNHDGRAFRKLSRLIAPLQGKASSQQLRLQERTNILSQGLEKVINEMDCIEKEMTVIKENSVLEDQQGLFFTPVASIRPPTQSGICVGRDDLLISVIDKLVYGHPNRQVIPITGMGGIGKTMLARKVYDSPHADQHFDIRGWITISQVYDVGKLLLRLLRDIRAPIEEGKNLAVHEMGLTLHKHLSGRRYLVALDDMWSIDAWEAIQRFHPDNSNGSRVMVTSRWRRVINCMDSSDHFEMNLLDENESWKLFHEKAFCNVNCPPEFKEVGKRIARNCKGLPLALIVIGGLLAKSKMILQDWEVISANISEIVNSADNESHLMLLSLSYNHLPMYLKPCFLYMGVFHEDEEIHVPRLINLLVAEGFVKPIQGRSMEEVAELYITDLIDRNLIFVCRRNCSGIIKDCKIHDLLRDLCLREAQKCRFLSLIRMQDPITQDISSQRRIGVQAMRKRGFILWRFFQKLPQTCHALKLASFLRSVVEYSPEHNVLRGLVDSKHLPLMQLKYFKLLRVLDVTEEYRPKVIFRLVNSRYISYPTGGKSYSLSSLSLFWNIQTLVMGNILVSSEFIVPSTLWEMPQLRQVKIYQFVMPEPPIRKGDCDIVVQKNLQTILQVKDFRVTEEILNGRPNIKKLKISQRSAVRFSDYLLSNLVFMNNLQSFHCWFGDKYSRTEVLEGIKFPVSLKKLSLARCPLEWDDLATTIGDLPQLEVLEFHHGCRGEEWNPLDGQFRSLKRLRINFYGPQQWNAGSTHFLVLEQLHLFHVCWGMREIPSGIGEIETLRSIHVHGDECHSLVASANEILNEKRMLGNDDFELIVVEAQGNETLMKAITRSSLWFRK